MRILVAYATRHGATRGIAERIGATLGQEGQDVTVKSVEEARDVGMYDAYVIGSAAYLGRWMKEASEFVRRHQGILAERPVWLFSSGPIGPDRVDKKGHDVIEASIPTEFAEFAELLHPRGRRVFFGAWDPDSEPVTFADRFMRMLPISRSVLPVGDFRDWPEIERWAREIAGQLQAVRVGVASR
jgi:menaquinone-dependent protoporphyrinogen oxidase